ncbi:MAG: calcium:proton antiporter [Alphaproteobacteria bacterium CG_4_10_14_0_2_um_filter_63_37]|nr:MAG: calcium:proton antiporter [Proteobacteria bacterium CG1_02_64_396]PJA25624.1 MAG: calcium:proton antiporter [Alphaproteobacteria bacterium CG_4_10_14_0_2_um_filter_63_37]
MSLLIHEKGLLFALVLLAVLFPLEHTLLHDGLAMVGAVFALIFAAILIASFRVAHHAEVLAHKLGEPFGTLILTVAAVSVEVIMLVILMTSSHNPTLVRDTIYAALMLDINGILGVAAIIGGLKHGSQHYNVDSSNSYIAMILTAVGVGMVIPDFIRPEVWRAYSVFSIVAIALMYVAFTRLQTIEHRYFFEYEYGQEGQEHVGAGEGSTLFHGALLVGSIAVIGVLAELLSAFMNAGIEATGWPLGLAAVSVAVISASPEILTALRAARADRMQTVVNIALGASLATVLLTIPVVEAIALATGTDIIMGLTLLQGGMIGLTLLVAIVNLSNGETNALEGMVHFVLFCTFGVLVFLV